MANIHIKSDECKAREAYVLDSFRKNGCIVTKADKEAAEIIAARSQEAYKNLKQMENKRNG